MSKHLKMYLTVLVGCFIMAVSVNLFFVPHHLFSSGVTGLAMIFYFLIGSPIGVTSLLLNIPLFLIAYRLLNRTYIFIALYGMVVVSFLIDLTSFLTSWSVVDDIMLAAIYGGVFFGIAAGMIFRVNGSTGGIDILAAVFRKYYRHP